MILSFSPQFDGEKDSRNPNDFTNCPSAKPDDGNDEDEIEDDEEVPSSPAAVSAPSRYVRTVLGGGRSEAARRWTGVRAD